MRPTHRKLTDHLRTWDAEQIAELLRRRPDLASPVPLDVAELAQRAQQLSSVAAAIGGATLPENRLIQVVVCLRASVPDEELARALPEGVTIADVEPVLASLEAAALVWRYAGRVHAPGPLRQIMPTSLGPPVHHFERALTVEHLRHALRLLRPLMEESHHVTGPLPPTSVGLGSRPPRKPDLLEELSALLSAEGAAAALSDAAPAAAADLIERLSAGPAWVRVGHSMWFSGQSGSSYYAKDPTYWLFERAVLLPEGGGVGALPREVVLSWRGGRPVDDLYLAEPPVVSRPVKAATVDSEGATQVARLLDQATEVLDGWAAEPAKALKTGGLGVAALRALATRLDDGVGEATRLVELLYLAGLLAETVTTTKLRRTYSREITVGPAPAATDWLAVPLPVRGRQLAQAWFRAERWPSLAGPKEAGVKAVPALSSQHQESTAAVALRSIVLDGFAEQAPGTALDPDALAASLEWHFPQRWGQGSPCPPSEAIGWILGEAEALGVTAQGAMTTFGRALWAGDAEGAEAALTAALPAAATSFTLQADLTAVVVGRLPREVTAELRLLADIESTGAATTFRFSDASLRRGLDAGRDAASITAFLKTHAARGVPKALAYLVTDVERRHGHLQVGVAAAFVTSDDPAVLADAVSHRRTRKLGLRLLAPTVAVSPQPPAVVLAGLRDVGFLPVPDGDEVVVLEARPGDDPVSTPAPPTPADEADPPLVVSDLPEPFRSRPEPRRLGRPPFMRGVPQPDSDTLDARAAARLAKAILAGGPGKGRRFQ